MSNIFLGTQRWYDPSWIGSFYPSGTDSGESLSVYSRVFQTVELWLTFFHIPPDVHVAEWASSVPDGFMFAPRVPLQVTHELKLQNAGELLARFVARIEQLENRLGPMLIQLPPDFQATQEHIERLRVFLHQLDRNHGWAVEFRHESWIEDSVLTALEQHGVALALTDGRWIPRSLMLELAATPTADFAYVRWHGAGLPYTDRSRARDEQSEALSEWARVLWRLASEVDSIWGYFSDQFEGHAPHSARVFQRMMGQTPIDPSALETGVEA